MLAARLQPAGDPAGVSSDTSTSSSTSHRRPRRRRAPGGFSGHAAAPRAGGFWGRDKPSQRRRPASRGGMEGLEGWPLAAPAPPEPAHPPVGHPGRGAGPPGRPPRTRRVPTRAEAGGVGADTDSPVHGRGPPATPTRHVQLLSAAELLGGGQRPTPLGGLWSLPRQRRRTPPPRPQTSAGLLTTPPPAPPLAPAPAVSRNPARSARAQPSAELFVRGQRAPVGWGGGAFSPSSVARPALRWLAPPPRSLHASRRPSRPRLGCRCGAKRGRPLSFQIRSQGVSIIQQPAHPALSCLCSLRAPVSLLGLRRVRGRGCVRHGLTHNGGAAPKPVAPSGRVYQRESVELRRRCAVTCVCVCARRPAHSATTPPDGLCLGGGGTGAITAQGSGGARPHAGAKTQHYWVTVPRGLHPLRPNSHTRTARPRNVAMLRTAGQSRTMGRARQGCDCMPGRIAGTVWWRAVAAGARTDGLSDGGTRARVVGSQAGNPCDPGKV
jgi:hypothetical protein